MSNTTGPVGACPNPTTTNMNGNFTERLAKATANHELAGHTERTPFRASAAGKCRRAMAYTLSGEEPKPTQPRFTLIRRIGHLLHADMQEVLHMDSVEKEVEVRVPLLSPIEGHTTCLKGHIDGIMDIDGAKHVVDIKTTADFGFRDVIMMKKPLERGYRAQMECYMRALDLPGAFLFYNKNTSHVHLVQVEPDEEIWNDIRCRYTDIELLVEANASSEEFTVPPHLRDYEPVPEKRYRKPTGRSVLPWQCSYCEWVEHCWPEAQLDTSASKPVYVI